MKEQIQQQAPVAITSCAVTANGGGRQSPRCGHHAGAVPHIHTHAKEKKKNRVQLHAVDGEEAHASTCVCCSFQVCSIPQEGSRHMAPRWR